MTPRTTTSASGAGRMKTVSDGIPFLDLAGQHAEIANQLDEAWAKVTSTNGFIGGPYVAAFEAEYAKALKE